MPFTDEEQVCISNKIRKLRDDGKPQDQAIAIAISVCAPKKSYEDMELPISYKAEEKPNGSVVISGVPVFAENKRGDKTFGQDWLKSALYRDSDLRSKNYKAPIHFGHHEPGVDRERAGYYELSKVQLANYSGSPTWVLFANLIFDSKEKSEKARQYPYRSVEISSEHPSEINSLALLSSEAPYFRFPTLTFRAWTGGESFLWRDTLEDKKEDLEKKPDEKKYQEADCPEWAKAMSAKLDMLMKMLGGEEDKQEPVVAAKAVVTDQFAAGQVEGLVAKVSFLEKKIEADKQYAALECELSQYALGPNWKKDLRKRVEEGTAEAWASGIKTQAPKFSTSEKASVNQDCPALSKYSGSPVRSLEAKRLADVYAGLPEDSFLKAGNTLEKFLDIQMRGVG